MGVEEKQAQKKRPFETYETTISEVVDLTPRNKGIRFQLPQGKSVQFKAGQFFQVFSPLSDDKTKRTSYSIASPPQQTESFDLCVTLVEGGKASTFIHNLKVGDKVTAMGPLGRFTLPDPLTRDLVFICTGSGIAPFRSMIIDLLHRKVTQNLYLVFGNRYDDDIIYHEEWQKFAKENANFKVLFTLSRPEKWTGEKGYVQEKVETLVPNVKECQYFICGLTNMINAVEEKLQTLGVPKDQIHFERYD